MAAPDAVARQLQVLAGRPVGQGALVRDLEPPAPLGQIRLSLELVSSGDRDVDVLMRSGLPIEEQVDCPAAAERSGLGEVGQQRRDGIDLSACRHVHHARA